MTAAAANADPGAPVILIAPAVSGTPDPGEVLTTTTGTWGGTSLTFTYGWQQCDLDGLSCVAIPAATSSSFTVPDGDEQITYRSSVTATNQSGTTTAFSEPTAPRPPKVTYSYYEVVTDTNTFYRQGCSTKRRGAQGIVVLAFGNPMYRNGKYGVNLLYHSRQNPLFVPFARILSAVKAWSDGWHTCTSPTRLTTGITIAFGVNNNTFINDNQSGPWYNDCGDGVPNSCAFGKQLARYVELLRRYQVNHGYTYQHAGGGYDVEPGWREPAVSIPVVTGYASQRTRTILWDFGSMEANPAWSMEQRWLVATTRNDLPLPEIYCDGQAETWADLSAWGKDPNRGNKGRQIYFPGVMSTKGFIGKNCHDHVGTAYPPRQAWRKLWNTLVAYGVGQSYIPYLTQIACRTVGTCAT